MYKVIMVPTHGEDTERPALAVAINLALQWNAELRLIQVEANATDLDAGTTGFVETEDFSAPLRAAREKRLTALVAECRAWGVRAVPVIEEGPVGQALKRYAESSEVDLIVIASHGRGGLKRISLGSVTDYVIRNTRVPVLVVKPHATFVSNVPDNEEKRILVPLDGSAVAEAIIPHVQALALGLKAKVILLQILSPFEDPRQAIMDPAMPWWESQIASGQTYLSRVDEYLTAKGLTVQHEVVAGERISDGIISYALREHVDLIALATRGTGGLRRLVLGSVADGLSRNSPISVLIVHPDATPAETHDRITPREAVG
jgi:nucleotide-binding universal stress UspA family protein